MQLITSSFFRDAPWLFAYRRAVVVVGAGISVPSGIPDFRSPDGIFARLRSQLRVDGRSFFSHAFGMAEATRGVYLKNIADLIRLCRQAQPNPVHHFLAALPRSRTYTQNIDCLEEAAGMTFSKDAATRGVYLHGNIAQVVCQYCGARHPLDDTAIATFTAAEELACPDCRAYNEAATAQGRRRRPAGVMRPAIVHYHQAHPDGYFISRMLERDVNADLLIVIGTSLKVDGVRRLVKTLARVPTMAGRRVLVNLTPPTREWCDIFDFFYHGDCVDFVRDYQAAQEEMRAGMGKAGAGLRVQKRMGSATVISAEMTGEELLARVKNVSGILTGNTFASDNNCVVAEEELKTIDLSEVGGAEAVPDCDITDPPASSAITGTLRRLSLIPEEEQTAGGSGGGVVGEQRDGLSACKASSNGNAAAPAVQPACESTAEACTSGAALLDRNPFQGSRRASEQANAASSAPTQVPSLESKLATLNSIFDSPEMISKPILDDLVLSVQPAPIQEASPELASKINQALTEGSEAAEHSLSPEEDNRNHLFFAEDTHASAGTDKLKPAPAKGQKKGPTKRKNTVKKR